MPTSLLESSVQQCSQQQDVVLALLTMGKGSQPTCKPLSVLYNYLQQAISCRPEHALSAKAV